MFAFRSRPRQPATLNDLSATHTLRRAHGTRSAHGHGAAPERATRRRLLIGVADQEGSNYNVRVKALMYRSLATGMLVLGIPMAAAAECVSDPDGVLAAESLRAANFVFDGTVLSVDLVDCICHF
jgi:hypothetical protein